MTREEQKTNRKQVYENNNEAFYRASCDLSPATSPEAKKAN